MTNRWLRIAPLGIAFLVLMGMTRCLEAGSATAVSSRPLALAGEDRDVLALAGKIDLYLTATRLKAKVTLASLADDAEFLRRVYLDLNGKIPPVSEARAFLQDTNPDKRLRLVQRLLDGPGYVMHFTNVWRALLLPEVNANLQLRPVVPGFEAWLRRQLAGNARYDAMVRDLLTVSFASDNQNRMNPYERLGEPSPAAFYVAKEAKPENLGAATARLFLGIRLECAQCHDHKFAPWKREQFWGFAAFFGGMEPRSVDNATGRVREITGRNRLQIPGKEDFIEAAFLDDTRPEFKYKVSGRVTLADWITGRDNPYFARMGVNRIWAFLFGRGLVEPVDDFTPEHTPSHPELLDALAQEFAAHHFDIKFLIRSIIASQAYQLSSTQTDPGQAEPRLYACMTVKSLTPEQLFDSLAQATGYHEVAAREARPQLGVETSGARAEFLVKFTSQDGGTDARTTILQALYLMNGKLVADLTSLERSQTLTAVAESPFFDTAQRVEALYLATLSRKPNPDELGRLTRYVTEGGVRHDPRAALADVFWALLNSAEFILNH